MGPSAALQARVVAWRNVKARVFPGECSSTRGVCDREWHRTSRARQQAVVRVARPTACLRARLVAWRNVEARVFPASAAGRGWWAIGNGIVRAARVSKRLYGWHDQPLAYARGSWPGVM